MPDIKIVDLGNVTGKGVVKGGIKGDILIKKSEDDFDMEWRNIFTDIDNAVEDKMLKIVGPLMDTLDEINGLEV